MDTKLMRYGNCRRNLPRKLLVSLLLLAAFSFFAAFSFTRAQAACASPYIVQPGDGWIRIARRCGVTYEALRTANPALWQQREEQLQVGDQVQLPSLPPASPTATPTMTPWPTGITTPTAPTVPAPTVVNPAQSPIATIRLFWQGIIAGIRSGDFYIAYAYLTPQQQSTLPYAAFQAEVAPLHEVTITSIAGIQEDARQATVDAVIVAATGVGTTWRYQHLRYRYTLIPVNGLWRIDALRKLDVAPTPLPTGCAAAPPTRLQRGMRAYVLPQPPLPNRVFREPNRQSPLVGRIPPNAALTILDGPRCGQRSVWWYVQAENGVIGWTAEGQPGEYWLAPLGATGAPVVSSLLFCTQIDSAKRCLTPTTHFPLGLNRLEVNWTFQNLPVNTPIKHLWYHKGTLYHQRTHVIWPANTTSPSGFGYTFYAPIGGLPTGEWRLEFRRAADNLLLQTSVFVVGPSRRQ
ncbi:MAG: LysM peptidoglycan-binding domain-containing protein [Caldilineaceae bacterium]